MPIQPPQERPDLYDSYDLPAHEFKPSAAYREATMPSWMRDAINDRARQHQVEADSSAESTVSEVQTMQVGPVVELVQRQWQNENSVTVISLSTDRAGSVEALRKAEADALRTLADRLEHNGIQPGPLIVTILAKS